MEVSAAPVPAGSPRQCGDTSLTPDLQHSRYMSGESDDDSAHATPSDMTQAAQSSPRGSWPTIKMRTDLPMRAEEEVRKIHYIDSPANDAIPAIPVLAAASLSPPIPQPATAATAIATPQATATEVPASAVAPVSNPAVTSIVPGASDSVSSLGPGLPPVTKSSKGPEAAIVSPKAAAAAGEMDNDLNEPLPQRLSTTAPYSAASTPASTPGATPQTYARKRGRPRKHPLPDPNSMPPKVKRKLSADSAASVAKKKASAAAAARSAASSAGSLLSVPDLGRLIPQGSSSENAQTFIQNNLRLFADLFVALQKQASTDHSVRDEPNTEPSSMTDVAVNQTPGTSQYDAFVQESVPVTAATAVLGGIDTSAAGLSASLPDTQADASPSALTTSTAASSTKLSGPSDIIRDEIKRKMADVIKGREAIQAEMLQMRVDASFFENAQKTVDERIVVLRERIAKHTALLRREREATRKVREASRKAKKDRKAREKSLRDSEREERRLAQTFEQLEREIAAEEEERRRLEEVESSVEEDQVREAVTNDQSAQGQLDGFDAAGLDVITADGTPKSASATPSVANDTPAATDRAIGFSDEELAKVLGISTSELAGFSQTLELTSLQPQSTPTISADADAASHLVQSSFALLLPPDQTNDHLVTEPSDVAAETFDVAAFLEMASSFGVVPSGVPASEQEHEN